MCLARLRLLINGDETVAKVYHSGWCNCYRVCNWTQSSRNQTRPRTMDFFKSIKSVARFPSEGK
jgi:hypothetical protein